MDILAGYGNEQQDGLSPEDILQLQFKAVQETQSIFQPECQVFLELTTIFSPPTIEL